VPLAAAGFLIAGAAQADPCHAIPDRGPMPALLAPGAVFSGPVVYVGDGDGLCVDVSRAGYLPVTKPGGPSWVEVRLADFYAPELADAGGTEARAALARIAKGRVVFCVAGRRTYDRVAAVCRLDSISLGDRMRAAGIGEGGRGR